MLPTRHAGLPGCTGHKQHRRDGVEIASTENGSWKSSGSRNHKVATSEGSEHLDGKKDRGKDVPLEAFKVREVHLQKYGVEDGES